MAEETEKQIDETVPGGRYIVGDRVVDANGEEIEKAAKADLKVDAKPDLSDEPDTAGEKQRATPHTATRKERER